MSAPGALVTHLRAAHVALLLAGVVAVGLLVFTGPSARGTGDDEQAEDWRRIVDRMVDAADQRTFAGRLLVVSFAAYGPSIGEVEVVQGRDGRVLTSGSRSWVLDHRGEATFFGDVETGTLVRLGGPRPGAFSVDLLERNYDLRLAGRTAADTGDPVAVLELLPRGGDHIRERLHVHERSGLVLRRETFTGDGEPVRLVTFTELDLAVGEIPEIGEGWVEEEREVVPLRAAVSPRGMEILRDVGWIVPESLPGGFVLVDTFALGEGDGSSLHLLYTDGLYALSVYEQEGRLDHGAVVARGAERVALGAMPTYRWRGSEPPAYVWGAEARTFTAVSDAPPDLLARALATFPHESERSIVDRLRRGLERVLGLLRSSE